MSFHDKMRTLFIGYITLLAIGVVMSILFNKGIVGAPVGEAAIWFAVTTMVLYAASTFVIYYLEVKKQEREELIFAEKGN